MYIRFTITWILVVLLMFQVTSANRKCPDDKVWTAPCACHKTCEDPSPSCTKPCRPGCVCPSDKPIQGPDDTCITEEECCSLKCLKQGMIPDPNTYPDCKECKCIDVCKTINCKGDEICVSKEVTCVKAPCHPVGECIPSPCQTVKCSKGHVCVLEDVICKKEPCLPVAQCVIDKCLVGYPLTIFCGHGLNRKDCPDTHNCHIDYADLWAICCPKPCLPGEQIPALSCGKDDDRCPAGSKCNEEFGVCCEEFCPYGDPIPDVNCGRGGGCCPENHYCEIAPTDQWAVCCATCPHGDPLPDISCGKGGECCPSGYECKHGACCEQICPLGDPGKPCNQTDDCPKDFECFTKDRSQGVCCTVGRCTQGLLQVLALPFIDCKKTNGHCPEGYFCEDYSNYGLCCPPVKGQ